MKISSKSQVRALLLLCFGLLVYVSHKVYAQQTTLVLYDNFDERFLNPSRWAWAACYAGQGVELECVREIRDEQLHLAHRSFGLTNSNSGLQAAGAIVGFANPASIRSIRTDLVVLSVQEVPCAANPGYGGGAHFAGTFFNAGSGNASEDVGAQLVLRRSSSDPPGQLNVFGQIFQGGVYFPNLFPLGTVSVGTPVTATLSWDQPHHQFVVSLTNHVTQLSTAGMMPYTFPDTTPAASPFKGLAISAFPANCTANVTSMYVKAAYSNVYVGQ
jgi:hypothetical protein